MTEQELLAFIGEVFVWLLSVAGAAFLLVQFGAQKWIETKFAKNLEAFKAQKLHEFDILLTRKVKWHEKEHDVLSQSWEKLVLAHRSLKRAIGLLKQYPNIEEMSEEERERFFERSDLKPDELDYIKEEKKRGFNAAYGKILDHRALVEAHKAFAEFDLYFDKNKIFLRPHIKEKFEKASEYIWSAWVSKKMDNDENDYRATDFGLKAYETEKDNLKPLIEEIEDVIQKELFLSEGEEE